MKPRTRGGAVGTIAAGTTLNLHSSVKICTNTNAVGDHVTATLDGRGVRHERRDDSLGRDGEHDRHAAQAQRELERPDRHAVRRELGDLRRQDLPARRVGDVGVGRPHPRRVEGKDVQKVGVGAVAGAIAGKIIGKSTKGAVIGGAAGAAAGAGIAAATANYQGCIPSGGSIVVKLNSRRDGQSLAGVLFRDVKRGAPLGAPRFVLGRTTNFTYNYELDRRGRRDRDAEGSYRNEPGFFGNGRSGGF